QGDRADPRRPRGPLRDDRREGRDDRLHPRLPRRGASHPRDPRGVHLPRHHRRRRGVECLARIPLLALSVRPSEGHCMNPLSQKHNRDCTCDKETLDTELKAELCAMVHEDDSERLMTMVGVCSEQNYSRVKRILSTVARNAHLPYNRRDDLISYFGEAVIKMVSKKWREEPRQFDQMRAAAYILEMRTREILRQERLHGLLGEGTQSKSPAKRKKMEAVDKSRERIDPTRANPRTQGVTLTLAGLRPSAEAVALDDESSSAHELSVVDQYDESEAERSAVIAAIIRECDDKDLREDLRISSQSRKPKRRKPRYGDIARVFYARHREGSFPTKDDVIHELGLKGTEDKVLAREAGKRLSEVHEMSREAFSDLVD